jgi:hypothetical protein
MVETIKFSELRAGAFIEHEGEVITKEEALKRIQAGSTSPMYTVTQSFVSSILQQAYADEVNGVDTESYTTENPGKLIEVDILT